MKSIFLVFIFLFTIPFVEAQNESIKPLIGKRLGIIGYGYKKNIEIKNDSMLYAYWTVYSPPRACLDFFSEPYHLPIYFKMKGDTIVIEKIKLSHTFKNGNELPKGLLLQTLDYEKLMQTLVDSPLVIIKDKDLGTTYLSNGNLNYFDVDWLQKQPSNMLLYSDARNYIEQTGTEEKIEKKFEKLLKRVKKEEKKAGKQLYEIKKLSPNEALYYYNIIVRRELIAVIFIEE